MEKDPNVKRPKRRLCFPTNKGSVPSQSTEPLTLGDVDKILDDMDSASPKESSLSPSSDTQGSDSKIQHSVETSPVLQIGLQAKRHPPSEKVFAGDGPHAPLHATKAPIPFVADSEMVIKLPRPVKTSSPIEMVDVVTVSEKNNCKVVSPILFNCEVEEMGNAELEPRNTQEPLMDEFEVLSPPGKFTLKRPTASAHKNIVDEPGQEKQLVKEKTQGKPQILVVNCRKKSKRQASTEEQKLSSSDHSRSGGETTSRLGKDVSAFLQKVREAGQTRTTGKLQVKAPPLPPPPSEFEDDFLILEEDAPLQFAIPSKSTPSTKKRGKPRKLLSSDSSTDEVEKDGPQEAATKEKESENTNAEHRLDPVDLMTKINIEPNNNDANAGSGNEQNESATPQDPPAGDTVEQARPVKKKQKMKNISMKVSSKAKKAKMEQKEATKANNEIVSTNETNTEQTSNQISEGMQGPKDINEAEIEGKSHEIKRQTKRHKRSVLSDSSSLEENVIPGKRRRKPVGQWWMSCSLNSEETGSPSSHFSPKKFKEQDEEAGPSGTQTKVVKKENRKQAAAPSSRNKGKEKKGRQQPSHDSGYQVSHKVNRKKTAKPSTGVSPRTQPQDQVRAADWREQMGTSSDGCAANTSPSEPMEQARAQPRQRKPKEPRSLKDRRKPLAQKQQQQTPGPGTLTAGPMSAPKTVKRSLATFKDIFFQSASETPAVGSSMDTGRRRSAAGPLLVSVIDHSTHNEEAEVRSAQDSAPTPDCRSPLESTAPGLISGPSSMIAVQGNEDSCDLILPSPSGAAALTASDLCSAPLKPLNLQPKDKRSLKEWFSSLWSSSDSKNEVSPDHFQWFFYQGRVCGLQVDLNCGPICNGKLLLGSYMKKPLWVDHSAITVFNVLTSSVDVVVNGRKSDYCPGQAFMVQSGHAYSIWNVTAQPAVLYFTRILAESSD